MRESTIRRSQVLLAGWLLLGCRSPGAPAPASVDPMVAGRPEGCVLERWEDGDTAFVVCGSGTREVVRLLAIDAPESGFDDNSRTRAQWQGQLWQLPYATVLRCGKAATARAREICPEGSPVELLGDDRDKYDRRLAFIRCAGDDVNRRLLEDGYAGNYPYPADPERPRLCR